MTRDEVNRTIARELAPIAAKFAAGDFDAGDELIYAWIEVLTERQQGAWAAYENLLFDVQAKLDPFNVGCNDDRPKFAKHVVRLAAKWQQLAGPKRARKK